MAPFIFSGMLIAYSLFMGTAIDMSNLWFHKYRATQAAQAACESGAADLVWVASQGTAQAITNYQAAPTGFPLAVSTGTGSYTNPPQGTSLIGTCSPSSPIAMCAYATANMPGAKGLHVTWSVSNVTPAPPKYNPNNAGGVSSFTSPTNLPSTPPTTANGVLPYLHVTVSESVPTYLLSVLPWFHSPVTVTGSCDCGLTESGGGQGTATLTSNEYCFGSNTGSETCQTTPVVPGYYLTITGYNQVSPPWVWPGFGWDQVGGFSANGNKDAPVPPSGTQAIIAQLCFNTTQPCTSPVFTFPDTPVSSTTQVTVNISGNEASEGDIWASEEHGHSQSEIGSWVTLTSTQGTISPSTIPLNYYAAQAGISAQTTYDNMDGDLAWDDNSGWALFQPCDVTYTIGAQITFPLDNSLPYGPNLPCLTQYPDAYPMGPLVDTVVVTGITNLNQIHITANSSLGNEYMGYIWAQWGGTDKVVVSSFQAY